MTQREVQAQETVQDGKVFLNAESLKALRKQRGLSQDALAQLCLEHRLCVSIASIKRAETGKAVLYRTASHLARVYASDLRELISRPAADPMPIAGPDTFEAVEQRNVLGLLLLMAAQVNAMIEQFGGQQESPELAIFGLPRAYGSDAVRCLQCAIGLTQLLHGRCAALVIGTRAWPSGSPADPGQQGLRANAAGSPSVYVERSLGTHLGERFVFEPAAYAGDLLCLTHERHTLRGAQYPLIGRHVEVQQFKATLETTLAYQCGHILYLRGVGASARAACLPYGDGARLRRQGQRDAVRPAGRQPARLAVRRHSVGGGIGRADAADPLA